MTGEMLEALGNLYRDPGVWSLIYSELLDYEGELHIPSVKHPL